MEGPKEVYELGLCLEKLMNATAVALKDGFQPGQDVVVILGSVISDLAVAIGGIQELPADFKADPALSAMAIVNPCVRGVKALLESKK